MYSLSDSFGQLAQRAKDEIINKELNELHRQTDRMLEQMVRVPAQGVRIESQGQANGSQLSIIAEKKGKKHMGDLSILAKKLLSSDVRAMVKAGYLDSELDITRSGIEFVCQQYLLANLAELAKVAKKELKDKEEEE